MGAGVSWCWPATRPRHQRMVERPEAALSSDKSIPKCFMPVGGHCDSAVEVLTVHAAPHSQVRSFNFPEVSCPYDEIDGWDYHLWTTSLTANIIESCMRSSR
ncbi:hypothetical protein BDW68DRAFT_149951 [Aspergillus falconensis]